MSAHVDAFWRKVGPLTHHRTLAGLLLLGLALLFSWQSVSSHNPYYPYKPNERHYRYPIPLIHIESVDVDETVTITTANFPADQDFKVTMGAMGTKGVGGIKVAESNSGKGGQLTFTYPIPEKLQGRRRIAIRLQSAQGYFSYNWFYNNTTDWGKDGKEPDHRGVPSISILEVMTNESVTVELKNFPADQSFTVHMAPWQKRRADVIEVETFDSGEGGTFERTFTIPEELQGTHKIGIRLQSSHTRPYHAFDYFVNDPEAEPGTGGEDQDEAVAIRFERGATSAAVEGMLEDERADAYWLRAYAMQTMSVSLTSEEAEIGFTILDPNGKDLNDGESLLVTEWSGELAESGRYEIVVETSEGRSAAYKLTVEITGGRPHPYPYPPQKHRVPTFKVCSVVRNSQVTIVTHNFPADMDFTVTMGPMHSRGIRGYEVGSFDSGDGSSQTLTFDIPDALRGHRRIAIRAQSGHRYRPFFAFNWFYNNDANVC